MMMNPVPFDLFSAYLVETSRVGEKGSTLDLLVAASILGEDETQVLTRTQKRLGARETIEVVVGRVAAVVLAAVQCSELIERHAI